MPSQPRLTKTKHVAGAQCLKRLFLEEHRPEEATPPDALTQELMREGGEIGFMARRLYPGGFALPGNPLHHQDDVRETREMMEDAAIPAIFEAAFTHDDTDVRVDALVRAGEGEWDLVEFKSGSDVRPDYLHDVAIQLHVLRGAGVRVRSVRVVHPDTEYVYPGGEIDAETYFERVDVTEDAEQLQEETRDRIQAARAALQMVRGPRIPIGSHCNKPVRCPFYDHCRHRLPKHSVEELPRLHETKRRALSLLKIKTIRQIPEDFSASVHDPKADKTLKVKLTDTQERVRQVVASGEPYFDEEGIREALRDVKFPAHFVDFEAFTPGIPKYPNSRPYQPIPFQWSNHTLGLNGRLYHKEYLHGDDHDEPQSDPRPRFVKRLLEALDGEGSIFVYSSYENSRLNELARDFPEYEERIRAVQARLVDLYPIVQKNVYHPDFHGSFSIKKVLAAFVPELNYSDLEIQNGGVAAVSFAEIIAPTTTEERRAEICTNLLKYCERDTEAMVKLLLKFAPTLLREKREERRQGPSPSR